MFMGSPGFAVPALEALAQATDVQAVVSQPDRPAGRGLNAKAPDCKLRALALGLPVWQPTSLKKGPFVDELRALDIDLCVVVAYGRILPADVLRVPRFGCWNVHASLLPRYRGAAPIQWAIIRGEAETGVTLMQMDVGMDTGDILLQRSMSIDRQVTGGELHDLLAPLGAALLAEGLALLSDGTPPPPRPQDSALATMAPMLEKSTGQVDFAVGAVAVSDLVRGCDPWPGAHTTWRAQSLKLFSPRVVSGSGSAGVVLGHDRDGLIVACGGDAVAFAELQLPGKKRMTAQALLAGNHLAPGVVLGG